MKTRKELKEEYKQMKFKMGVFQIKNGANGKVFIGHSTDLTAIWHAQKLQLNNGMHANSELQNDWREFGADNFVYEILEELKQEDDSTLDINKELKALEEIVIEAIQPFDDKGYNRRSYR
ncbi:MAG: GIY-YIG nuclease family protein [Bacteroidota bacterium]